MKRSLVFLFVLVLLATLAPATRAGSRVAPGELRESGMSTVNEGIEIADGATMHGRCKSVNGRIRVGRNALAQDLSTVNGDIDVSEGAVVQGDLESVNGGVSLDRGASAESIRVVNGEIEITDAEVQGGISTVNGEVRLHEGAVVRGDLVIEETGGTPSDRRPALEIELTGGSVIEGNVVSIDPDRRVELYLRDGSRVLGRVENVTVHD